MRLALFAILWTFSAFPMDALVGTYELEEGDSKGCYQTFQVYASSTREVFYSITGDSELLVSIDTSEIGAGMIEYKDEKRRGKFAVEFDEGRNELVYWGNGLEGAIPYNFRISARQVGYDHLELKVKSFHYDKFLWFSMDCRYFQVD